MSTLIWRRVDGGSLYAYDSGMQVAGVIPSGDGFKAWFWPTSDAQKTWLNGTYVSTVSARGAVEHEFETRV